MAAFGSSSPDFGGNWEVYGPTGSRQEIIANVAAAYRLTVPAGGITITDLRRGLIDNTAGGTVWVGVYNYANGAFLGSANITLTTGGGGSYIWHVASGLNIIVPDTVSEIFLVTAQPTVDAWGTSETVTSGDAETDGSGTTLPSPFSGIGFTLAPPIQAEYSLGGGASAQIDSVADPVTVGANAHTVSNYGGVINAGRIYAGTAEIDFDSANNTQGVIPAIVNGGNAVPFGAVNYELTDGTDTDEIATNYNPPTGFSFVALTSGFDTSENSYLYSYGGTPAVGDQFLFPDSITLDNQGGIEGGAGSYTIYAIDVSDAQPVYEAFTLILGEASSSGSAPTEVLQDSIQDILGDL